MSATSVGCGGVGVLNSGEYSAERLLKMADDALYYCKAHGRNRAHLKQS